MSEWYDEAPPTTATALVEHRAPGDGGAALKEREAELLALEDEIFHDHYEIVRSVAMFKDVDPAEKEMSAEFAARFPSKAEAQKAYRLALSGWTPTKDAPSGVHFAYKVAMGVLKSREEVRAKTSDAKPLNVVVVLNQPVMKGDDVHVYQTLEVER